jgi:hypothetical protein
MLIIRKIDTGIERRQIVIIKTSLIIKDRYNKAKQIYL